MSEFTASKYVCYRDIDNERDYWCERSFMFNSQEVSKEFFHEYNELLLNIYTDEYDRVLHSFKVELNNPAGLINAVTFETEYAGNVTIVLMHSGFLINKTT